MSYEKLRYYGLGEQEELEIKAQEASLRIWRTAHRLEEIKEHIAYLEKQQALEPEDWRESAILNRKETRDELERWFEEWNKKREDLYERMEKNNV